MRRIGDFDGAQEPVGGSVLPSTLVLWTRFYGDGSLQLVTNGIWTYTERCEDEGQIGVMPGEAGGPAVWTLVTFRFATAGEREASGVS